MTKVSRPKEFHLEPHAEPFVNLSIYTAPIIQPLGRRRASRYGFVEVMSLIPAGQVGNLRQQDNAAPWLHPHYKSFITTTGGSAPRSGIGILPHGVCHLSFPLPSATRFSRSIPKPVLRSCRLYTDCHRVRKQVSSRLILEHRTNSSFDSAFQPNDASSNGLLSLIFSILT